MDINTQALINLEASIIGGILLKPDCLAELPTLETDDFLDLRHRVIWTAIRNLEARGTPLDVVTIEAEIEKKTGKADASWFAYLGEVALLVPTLSNVIEYAKQVREAALARRVALILSEALERFRGNQLSGGDLLTESLGALSRVDAEQPDDARPISAMIKTRFAQLDQIAQDRISGRRTMTGYPTGVAGLDEKIGGYQAGIVTIVAARPGMGKSSLGLATADECSARGHGVHVFSLEDTAESYSDRTLSRTSQVPAESMRNVELNRGQMGDISQAAAKLRGRPWLVDGRSGITADEIVRSVRRHRKAFGTCVVIVDYVQLVKRPQRLSPHEALTEIVTVLADAAKQDGLAYVVMSQLNRGVEQRTDKRPVLSDLRESGSLEERAKCVIGIYRGAYYGEPVDGIDWDRNWQGRNVRPSQQDHEATVQLHVLKNSNGRTGVVFARWHGPTTRME